jgi:hypothetical protein
VIPADEAAGRPGRQVAGERRVTVPVAGLGEVEAAVRPVGGRALDPSRIAIVA